MANFYTVKDIELSSIADAIRTKAEISDNLAFPSGFVSAIEGIEAGGFDGTVYTSEYSSFTIVSPDIFNDGYNVETLGYTDAGNELQFDIADASAFIRQIKNNSLSVAWHPVLKSIKDVAFQSCTSLTSISFPVCTSIGSSAFYSCRSLTSISFPNCTSIGSYAFDNCTSLTSVSFPNCTSIGPYAFAYCPSFTSISFPVCTSIGGGAFYYCRSLASISFPACTRIGSSAFYECRSLTSISFPACTSIGASAFRNCYNLVSLYLTGSSVCALGNSVAFTSTPIAGYTASTGGVYGSIYVPASLVDQYKSATNWSYFSERFVGV